MGEQIDREKIKSLEMERVRRRLKVDPTGEMRMVAIVRYDLGISLVDLLKGEGT